MNTYLSSLLAIAVLAVAPTASADPAHNLCVPPAPNLPTFEGPPNWDSPAPAAGTTPPLDDPRWTGATQRAFEIGGATAPLHARAVWASQPDPAHPGSNVDMLYLQFIVDVEGIASGVAKPRDVFVAFRRNTPLGNEVASMFQFHLTGKNTTAFVTPTYCSSFDQCDENTTTQKDFWRLFVDHGNKLPCGGSVASLETFASATTSSNPNPPLDLTKAGAVNVAYWKVSAGPMQNRWAVEVRIPLAAPGQALSNGIDRDSTIWYEATTRLSGGDYSHIAWWPSEDLDGICVSSDALLGDSVAHADLSNPDAFGRLTLIGNASTPANHPACDGGISITGGDIGSLPNATLPIDPNDPTHLHPPNLFAASTTDTPIINRVVAFPENKSGADIKLALRARFRLASWGSAPWSVATDHGKWKDLRGAENGVCSSGTSPSCNEVTIPANKRGLVTFNWQIGEASNPMGDSEYCKFGLQPPTSHSTTCVDCTCTGTDLCDALSDAGTQAVNSSTHAVVAKCVSKVYQGDQCLLVELDSSGTGSPTPTTTVFENQSAWNNMRFGEMSTVTRQALIDARQLPVAPGQQYQDIYFVVMPRNMPGTTAANATGQSLINDNALAVAHQIAEPYLAQGNIAERVKLAAARPYARPPGNTPIDRQALEDVERVMQLMPERDYERANKLVQVALARGDGKKPVANLVKSTVEQLGPTDAAQIVPTLEIYPYYRPNDTGHGYLPMTAFTIFLSHEGSLAGMHVEIDGVDRVSENVYHTRIPVHYAKKIQIRAQAVVPPEPIEPAGNPRWPGCACGGRNTGLVAGLSNMGPGLAAGIVVIALRRKRKAKS